MSEFLWFFFHIKRVPSAGDKMSCRSITVYYKYRKADPQNLTQLWGRSGGTGSYLWSYRFWSLHDCPSKEICQLFENSNEHARSATKSRANYSRICVFLLRGDSIVVKEFVFCYCLFAVSNFGDSTAFGHHISLNSGSVYTRAVYYVKNMSVVVVLSKT